MTPRFSASPTWGNDLLLAKEGPAKPCVLASLEFHELLEQIRLLLAADLLTARAIALIGCFDFWGSSNSEAQ